VQKSNFLFFVVSAGIMTGIGGCSALEGGVVESTPKNQAETGGAFDDPNDKLFSSEGISLRGLGIGGDAAGSGNALPVNKYLWRASLDTLNFLPLASTDPFSGVITTEWGASPETPNERVRVTARVDGKELTARALDVAVFRETLNPSGAWVAATVNPATAEQVKDNILQRARELRINDIDGPRV